MGVIFDDLRRTFVTGAEHSGAPRHEVMAITGHKTESVYTRYAIGNREGAVPRWKRSNATARNERAGNGANRR